MSQTVLAYRHGANCQNCSIPTGGSGDVSISASVGRGGRNIPADVRAVQQALNRISPVNGGPALALAVDGIVGPKTLAAILAFQKREVDLDDGRIDPNGPTLRAVNSLGASQGVQPPQKGAKPAPIPPAATDAENKAFIQSIGRCLPVARRLTQRAMRTLDMAIDANSDRGNPLFPNLGVKQFGIVNDFYKIQPLSRPLRVAYMRDLHRVFFDMQVVISQSLIGNIVDGYGCGFFQPDPGDGTPASTKYDAYTFYGGWLARNKKSGLPRMSKQDNYAGANLREDTIFFPVSHYKTAGDIYIAVVILHELAHFVGPGVHSGQRIGDHGQYGDKSLFRLNSTLAKRNADTYAWFAADADLNM
jgi:peptidoglycan hydrolase-like protein with peptidoglycan-binding domain